MPQRIETFRMVRDQYVSLLINALMAFETSSVEIEPLRHQGLQSERSDNILSSASRADFLVRSAGGEIEEHRASSGAAVRFKAFSDPIGIGLTTAFVKPFS